MVDVKAAVKAAAGSAKELIEASDVLLEEVELTEASDGHKVWLITLSLPARRRSTPVEAHFGGNLSALLSADREYKQFAVNAETGAVEAMKIRELSRP